MNDNPAAYRDHRVFRTPLNGCDEYNEDKVVGVIRRQTLINYYNTRLIETLRK